MEYYKGVLNGQALRFINGYLEVEALEDIQGLSIQDAETLNDFLQSIEVVTRSVYITTELSLDLSSLVNVGGIYRVTGHAVEDTALTVTGGMFLDYDGGYFYPNLRQVNAYTLNIEDGLAEGLLALISQFIPDLGFNYGAIQLSNYTKDGNTLGTLGIDFSGLQVPTVIFSEVNYVEGEGSLPIPVGLATGIVAPHAESIKLGNGVTSYVFAPMATYVELNVERNSFTFEEDSFDYLGGSDANEIYPGYVAEFLMISTNSFSGFVVAARDGEEGDSEVVLNGSEATGGIFVMADRVSAPNLETILGSSWIESPNVDFPELTQILNSGELYLTENKIQAININGITSVDAIKGNNPLNSGQITFR